MKKYRIVERTLNGRVYDYHIEERYWLFFWRYRSEFGSLTTAKAALEVLEKPLIWKKKVIKLNHEN